MAFVWIVERRENGEWEPVYVTRDEVKAHRNLKKQEEMVGKEYAKINVCTYEE